MQYNIDKKEYYRSILMKLSLKSDTFDTILNENIIDDWAFCIGKKLWRYDLFKDNFFLWVCIVESNYAWKDIIENSDNMNLSFTEYSLLQNDFKCKPLPFRNFCQVFIKFYKRIKFGTGDSIMQSDIDNLELYFFKNNFFLQLFRYPQGKDVDIFFETIK